MPVDAWVKDRYKIDHLYQALEHAELYGVAVDVGAHHGIYAQLLAGRFPSVVAYEPHEPAYRQLVRNTRWTPQVECYSCAVLARPCTDLRMYRKRKIVDVTNDQGVYVSASSPDDVVVQEDVEAVSLDEHMRQYGVTFLKIDVEGAELEVLKGAEMLLSRDRPVLMIEVVERYLRRRFGTSPDELDQWLRARSYRLREQYDEDHVYTYEG